MKSLFVVSWEGFSGKTAFILGLSQVLTENGFKVSYFRPIGRPQPSIREGVIDPDVLLMKEALKLPYSLEELTPILIEPNYLSVYAKRDVKELKNMILTRYNTISQGADIIIVEGGVSPETMTALRLNNIDVAELLNSKVLVISGGVSDSSIEKILFYKNILDMRGIPIVGAVLNQIPPHMMEKTEREYMDLLKRNDIRVWGAVPRNYEISSPTVRELLELLEGEVLVNGDINRVIENIFIGAMQTESSLRYFRRSENNAIITGGDRADIISAAVETNASVIVLTGNMKPPEQVLVKAEEKNITVVMVPQDTYSTVKILENLTGKIKPSDTYRISLTKKMVYEHVHWRELYDSI
ncbi:MAG: AAA family ATPase [Candidatus Odinarchaeum yellowstonii]|uniref:AAA family ATPase n=1 Tax=Odinarchaeota yellowstonii (strain LCB_4) TaxID=1841599 RepID=A0AAF0D2G8_ODILC|nr:MAG: AAA family ATPase [Candidatus Odinarchaeum yellowstonii]